MTDEYIRRVEAEEAIEEYCCRMCKEYSEVEGGCVSHAQHCEHLSGEEILKPVKSADVQPVIHAHWIRGEEKGFRTYNPLWYCSNCGGQIRYDTRMRQYPKIKRPVWEVNAFCRKCGARMDGDTE